MVARFLRARMSVLIYAQESVGFDGGISLGGGEAGVSEKFLDGAQVASGVEQMGCKTVAQTMGSRACWQAKTLARFFQMQLNHPCAEAFAAFAEEEGGIGSERKGAETDIDVDSVAHDGKHRNQTLFIAFSEDGESFSQRQDISVEAQGFGDSQPAAIEKGEDGDIARLAPVGGLAW